MDSGPADRSRHERVRAQWVAMPTDMLWKYRRLHPDDPRTDRELAESLMAFFHEQGAVGRKDGRWIVPESRS
jgi:hypothetical protein